MLPVLLMRMRTPRQQRCRLTTDRHWMLPLPAPESDAEVGDATEAALESGAVGDSKGAVRVASEDVVRALHAGLRARCREVAMVHEHPSFLWPTLPAKSGCSFGGIATLPP